MVCSMQTMHLFCIKISTISKQIKPSYHQTELPLEPLHLGVLSGASTMVLELMVHYAQTVHHSCTQTNTNSKRTEARFHMTHHVGVLSGVSKLFSENMLRSMQIVHLSCIKISTISKQIEPSFHLSLFTQAYHRVLGQWFLILWCISCKQYTYLVMKLTLSPNRPKQDSI